MNLGDGSVRDVDQYQYSTDEDSGFPIYVLFEVIHVYRKTAWDKVMEEEFLI